VGKKSGTIARRKCTKSRKVRPERKKRGGTLSILGGLMSDIKASEEKGFTGLG